MALVVSMSKRQFFETSITSELPADAKPISADAHRELFDGMAAGLVLDWSGDAPALIAAPAYVPTTADVDTERDRRIDAGVEFNGVMFQSRATDRENIAGAAQMGFMAVVAGATAGDLRWLNAAADFAWIAQDNSLVPMDAQTVVAFGKAAAERKQSLIFASRQIKDMGGIPADYTDDKWWP